MMDDERVRQIMKSEYEGAIARPSSVTGLAAPPYSENEEQLAGRLYQALRRQHDVGGQWLIAGDEMSADQADLRFVTLNGNVNLYAMARSILS